MEDEHRGKIDNRLTPIDLYKLTPRTNCRECGFASCLAFATQVVVGKADLEACPHLDPGTVGPMRSKLAQQHEAGIGVSRESFEKTLEFLRREADKWDFRDIAESLGARFFLKDGKQALALPYFGSMLTVTREDIADDSGTQTNPWEKILIYNYVIGGACEPSGSWVGMESLPNSVSKIKSLKSHCEKPLAERYAGRLHELPETLQGFGRTLHLVEEKVDFAAEFQVFPKLAVRVLWWDEDPAEGFRCETKFLFDSKVLQVIDLESLVFASEQITDRLMGREMHDHSH